MEISNSAPTVSGHPESTPDNSGSDIPPSGTGNSTSPPNTVSSHNNLIAMASSRSAEAEITSSSASSKKMYVLIYNASIWPHQENTDRITLLDGRAITVAYGEYTSPATIQPVGVLGIYQSEAKARRIGKAWLYDQLRSLGVQLHLPLPTQDGSECTELDWRKSGWQRVADGSWGYSVSDHSPRKRALVVYVTAQSPVADDNDDGAEEEYEDSDDAAGKQQYKIVGSVGSRKRVVKTSDDEEEEEEEESEEEGSEGSEGSAVEVTAEEGENDELEDEDGETAGGIDSLGMAEFWDEERSEQDPNGSSADEEKEEDAAEDKIQGANQGQ